MHNDISSIFIRRPVLTTLAMVALVFFGIIAFRSLPVAALPAVDFPTISVSASLPGANPDTMASSVATPLERQFSTIAGLTSMSSSSSLGSTNITLQFDLSRDIDAAAQDVQTAISAASRGLPTDMPSPPTYRKVNPADQPIYLLAISSDSLPIYKTDEYAETLVAQRLSMIDGVAQVNVFGSQKYAVHAQLNPDLLAARAIGIDDVRTAISTGNVNMPTGNLYGVFKSFSIQTNGRLQNAAQYRGLVVAYKNGNPVRLEELGDVVDGVENDKTASWFNGKRAIVLAIMRQPGTNTVGIVDEIKRTMPKLRQQIPGAVSLEVLYDRSQSIRQSVQDVEMTLLITVVMVIGVIFLFLQNGSATLIPSLALPTSLIGTFAVMKWLGFSLNNLTLMALTLSVGFVVDDAVVVLENIVRHVEMGESPFEAAVKGTREIWFTVITMTLSLVAVFIPILFMGGIIGRVFNEFAVTIASAILLSAVVSLSLTPMLASRWLKPGHTAHKNRILSGFERGWSWTSEHYARSLNVVLEHRLATLATLALSIVLAAVVFTFVGKGFMPDEDAGQITISTEGEQDISFDSMVRHQKVVAAIALKDPSVKSVMSSVGSGGGTSNQGRMFVILKPLNERPRAQVIINRLRPKLAQVPGIRAYPSLPPTIRIGGMQSKALYQATLTSPDSQALQTSTNALANKMQAVPYLSDVNTDIQNAAPQVNVEVNHDLASSMGITQEQVEEALADAYGMRQVSTIYAPTNQYHVIVEVQPQYQRDPAALAKLYVHSTTGASVPLGVIAKFSTTAAPLTVNHLGQFPAATISFNLPPGTSLGTAVQQIQNLAVGTVAPDVSLSFQGQAQAFQSSFENMGVLLLVATAIIYMILGMLYESFIHPLTILSGLPAAGLGALLTLMLFHVDLDIYGFLGLIMLIGIVKKNAIMMIDFAIDRRRSQSIEAQQAIHEACLVRFRPIMMTTAAALMGAIPIALGMGAGGESRQPLGLAVLGGLIVSQILTLYITPVVYIYLDRVQERLARRNPNAGPEMPPSAVQPS
jgi:HAE1 family hydrophobic/amphiphilic exporter-1